MFLDLHYEIRIFLYIIPVKKTTLETNYRFVADMISTGLMMHTV